MRTLLAAILGYVPHSTVTTLRRQLAESMQETRLMHARAQRAEEEVGRRVWWPSPEVMPGSWERSSLDVSAPDALPGALTNCTTCTYNHGPSCHAPDFRWHNWIDGNMAEGTGDLKPTATGCPSHAPKQLP